MSITSWRMLVVATACLIAASLGTAIETNEEIPSKDIDLFLVDHEYVDRLLRPLIEYLKKVDDEIGKFHSDKMNFSNQDASPNGLAGLNGVLPEALPVPSAIFELSPRDGSIKKRISDDIISSKDEVQVEPTVQEFKLKKGKIDMQMICYFKLCSFRRYE